MDRYQYEVIGMWFGIPAFIITWGICAVTQGFLGICLGFIPALVVGYICTWTWPLPACALIAFIFVILGNAL